MALSPTTARLLTAGIWSASLATIIVSADRFNGKTAQYGLSAGLAAIHLAPLVGYGYADEFGKGILLSGLAGLGTGIAGFGVFIAALGEASNGSDPSTLTQAAILGGVALHAGVILYSIVDSGRAARRTNIRRRQMWVTPSVGTKQAGLVLSGSF